MIFKNRRLQIESRGLRNGFVKGLASDHGRDWAGSRNFLTIAPALPQAGSRRQESRSDRRSASAGSSAESCGRFTLDSTHLEMPPHQVVHLQTTADGKVQATRSHQDRERNPDRVCLDRRGLTQLPNFTSEKNIRMLSLQHNLIGRIDGFPSLGLDQLVFLDLYNNQVETVAGLDSLENLRVLLFGKNRLKKIAGIESLTKLEILDLHGNQIDQMSGLSHLSDLKVLNLAGNRIRTVGESDLQGLLSLQELNLKRNRLRKISDLTGPSRLEKLFLSNNEISSMDDLSGVCKSSSLKEIAIDGNPISLGGDCVHLLVSHLPDLQVLSHVQVTESVRRSAATWRKNRENLLKIIAHEPREEVEGSGDPEGRVEAISKARSNWELLRRQAKLLPSSITGPSSSKEASTVDESDSNVEKTIQTDSVVSVASSMTLSSKDGLPDSKGKGRGKKSATRAISFSEEAPDASEPSEIPECFKLPPISATLTGGKSRDETFSNSSSRKVKAKPKDFDEKDEVTLSETSEGAEDSGTDESDYDLEESGNLEESEKVGGRRLKSANPPAKKSVHSKDRCCTAKAKMKFQAPAPGKVREQGGDYLIEICGRCLNVYGQGALRFIDRPWNSVKAGDVTTVRFNYVGFGGICTVLSKLKQRFPNAENFVFRETNMTVLGQLNALADVQGLSALQIDREGNPIAEKNWRNYAIYRLAHWGLKKINGREVTQEDLAEVGREFQGLSEMVFWCLPESLLQPLLTRLRIEGTRFQQSQQSAKQWLLKNADPALRTVVCKEALQWRRGTQEDLCWRQKGKNHLDRLIDLTCSAVEKLRLFEARWPTILNQLVRDTLVDYSQMDSYMKKCIQELQ